MTEQQQPGAPQAPRDPHVNTPATPTDKNRWVLWLTVGVLIAAAVIGGFFILIGNGSGLAGRVWTTFLLVVLFAGAVVLDAYATGRNAWYLPASTSVNAVLLIVGLLKIWTDWNQPVSTGRYGSSYTDGADRFFSFIGLIVVLRLALLLTQFVWPTLVRGAKRAVTRNASLAMLIFVWLTALVLALPAAFSGGHWASWWWRMSGAFALVAVVLAVIPMVFRAFEPRAPRAQQYYGAPGQYQQGWGVPDAGGQPWQGQPGPVGPGFGQGQGQYPEQQWGSQTPSQGWQQPQQQWGVQGPQQGWQQPQQQWGAPGPDQGWQQPGPAQGQQAQAPQSPQQPAPSPHPDGWTTPPRKDGN